MIIVKVVGPAADSCQGGPTTWVDVVLQARQLAERHRGDLAAVCHEVLLVEDEHHRSVDRIGVEVERRGAVDVARREDWCSVQEGHGDLAGLGIAFGDDAVVVVLDLAAERHIERLVALHACRRAVLANLGFPRTRDLRDDVVCLGRRTGRCRFDARACARASREYEHDSGNARCPEWLDPLDSHGRFIAQDLKKVNIF